MQSKEKLSCSVLSLFIIPVMYHGQNSSRLNIILVGFEGHDLSRLYLGILNEIHSTNAVHM